MSYRLLPEKVVAPLPIFQLPATKILLFLAEIAVLPPEKLVQPQRG